MKRIPLFILFLCAFSATVFADQKWTLYKTDFETGTHQEKILSLEMEGDIIWAGTAGGVVKWNRKTGVFIRYTAQDGLINDFISAIAIDHSGVKWFGHEYANPYLQKLQGITSYNDHLWQQYTIQTIPEFARTDSTYNNNWRFSIDDILVDPANTVLVSSNGYYTRRYPDGGGPTTTSELFIFDQKGWKIKHIGGGWSYKMVLDIANPDTIWWCYEEVGAGYMVKPDYDIKIDDRFYSANRTPHGRSIAVDKNGNVWFCDYGDVFLFDRHKLQFISRDITGMKGMTYAIAVDQYNVKWFGSQLGITRYDGMTWKTYAPEGWTYKDDASYSDIVRAMKFDDDGALWVGTNKGLYKFEETAASVNDISDKPASVRIIGIAPNPFNPSTTISFDLPAPGAVRLSVYDITGRRVRELAIGRFTSGSHSVVWDGRDERGIPVSSGVYLSRLESGGTVRTAKMLLMK